MNKCIDYTGHINKNGYGSAWYQGKTIGAHRKAWILKFGQIPEGKYVCHKCDNRKCINPEHLFVGTAQDNVVDMVKKGRHRFYNPLKTKDGMRECFACKETKPETEFHKNGVSKYTGIILRQHVCKKCRTFNSKWVQGK